MPRWARHWTVGLLALTPLLLSCFNADTGKPPTAGMAAAVTATVPSTATPTPTVTPTPTPIPTPTPTPLPSGEALIQGAAERLAKVKTAVLHVEGDGTPIELGAGIKVDTLEATVARPDRMKLKATSSFGKNTLELEMLKIGRQLYLLNPFGRTWQRIPAGASPLEAVDPFAAADVFRQASNMSRSGRETLGGIDTWVVRAEIPPDAVIPLVGGRLGDEAIRSQLWIGTQDALLRRIRLEMKVAGSERAVTLVLSDFDRPVTIELPQ